MRLLSGRAERWTSVPFLSAARGGGTEAVRLDVELLRVDSLPAGCSAVLVAGDLQGIAPSPVSGQAGLLGVALADYLHVWADEGLLPPPTELGVLLTGDLYSAPDADVRGASGDVFDVWLAFAAAGCPMVFGVAGNHDEVDASRVAGLGADIALLDGERRKFGGLTVAGVGGVIGDPGRAMRRTGKEFLAAVERATNPAPDVLLLHEGPTGNAADQRGNPAIRALLERRPPGLTLCGHVHWERATASLGTGALVNTDARAVILVA
ncbi:metallophosphoesterase [Actinoplanes bogorensis]|uniref:Metallophosphoesterase n=2 Tax=Paractinoplanes bogorensis TaxID=1610840 RepID=A0ABS5Z2N2_9ACTN|nr:metallophosphoesterase [Actinoplanes bogorensis]